MSKEAQLKLICYPLYHLLMALGIVALQQPPSILPLKGEALRRLG